MEWRLDKARPLCPQIAEQLCLRIATGEFAAGERLLSVREVAALAGINPNTVQRAFEGLERQGILYSVRGSGWYAAEDTTAAKDTLSALWAEKTAAYFAEMEALGMNAEQTKKYLEDYPHE